MSRSSCKEGSAFAKSPESEGIAKQVQFGQTTKATRRFDCDLLECCFARAMLEQQGNADELFAT